MGFVSAAGNCLKRGRHSSNAFQLEPHAHMTYIGMLPSMLADGVPVRRIPSVGNTRASILDLRLLLWTEKMVMSEQCNQR